MVRGTVGLGRIRALAAILAVAACGEGPSGPSEAPTFTSLEPAVLFVGEAGADVTFRGSGFTASSVAIFDGLERLTDFVSSTELSVSVRPADLSFPRQFVVWVSNGDGARTSPLTLTVENPLPVLSSISPDEVDLGSGSIVLTVQGAGFVRDVSFVRYAGLPVPTTFVSSTELTASIGSTAFATPGYRDVRVVTPEPGGGITDPIDLGVRYPRPRVTSAAPGTVTAGQAARLSFLGAALDNVTEISIDGTRWPVQASSPSILHADVPDSALATAGTVPVWLVAPEPGGGASDSVSLTIAPPSPTVSGFSPPSVAAGGAAFTLTVTGDHFGAGAEVHWNGVARSTTRIDAQTLEIPVGASDVAAAGSGMVSVVDPTGGTSPVVGFPITQPTPTVTDSFTVAVEAADLVTSPAGDIVYAAVRQGAATYENEVVAMNPATGAVLWSTPAGSDPRRIVISDDGRYIYVALGGAPSITRIDTQTQASDLDIPLSSPAWRVEDLITLPDAPTTVVASVRNTCCSPRFEQVVAYDGATPRPVVQAGHTGSNRIERSLHPDRIYGYENESSGFTFRTLLVTADGVVVAQSQGGVVSNFGTEIVHDAGLLFSTHGGGTVIDPEVPTVLGSLGGQGAMRPDVANGRVLFFQNQTLAARHLSTFTSLGTLDLPSASGSNVLVRFGVDGLAFGGGQTVTFVRSPLIGS